MTELTIRQIGDPVLRERAKKVKNFGPKLQQLIDDMVETMHAANGVGLAAPQIGESLRLFVAYLEEEPPIEGDDPPTKPPPPNPHLGKLHVVINPELLRESDEELLGTEGCLSIPGFLGDVYRPEKITVRYFDRRGHKQRIKLRGWLARVFLHEMDHLDGVLFVDKAETMYDVRGDEPEAVAD